MDIKAAKLLLIKATESLRHARYDQAREILSAFRSGDPLYSMHLHLLGIIHHALGRPLDAVALFRRALHGGECSPALIPSLLQAATAAGIRDENLYSECLTILTSYPEDMVLRMLPPVLDAASFKRESTFEWNTLIYRTIALPLLHWCLENDCLDDALFLESRIYPYVQQRETESHYRECFMAWTGAMYAAGQRHAQEKIAPYNPGKSIRVGFFVEKLLPLIHVQSVLEMLQGYRKTGTGSMSFSIYVFARKVDKAVLEQFRELGVNVIILGEEFPETFNKRFTRLQHLSSRLADDRIDVLVWVSLALMMPLAFGMRIAPVQIWLSVKYHSIEFPGIDRYMTRMGFSKTREINGRVWDNIPPSLDDWPIDQGYKSMAQPIRDKFSGRLILGTFGREEKLTDPRFLKAIAQILTDNHDTVFLYTGRRNHPIIQDILSDTTFPDRAHYIGWVDTRLYANVVDIFLDSFPFPCGLTLFEAMSVGTPAVMRDSVESRETGLVGHILPIIEGTDGTGTEKARICGIFGGVTLPYLFIARSDDEYIAMTSRLISDPALRQRAGSASQQFINTFMTGTERAGEVFAEHVRNAVSEKFTQHTQPHKQ